MNEKNQKGITLIALIITIIVLLILAGVTIAQIAGNDSAPNKAVEARTKNEQGAAKDAATLLVVEKIQDYYEAKHLNGETDSENILTYLEDEDVLGGNKGTTGEYKVKVEENTQDETTGVISVKKETQLIATGTVDSSGVITWDDTIKEKVGAKIKVGDDVIDLSEYNSKTVTQFYGETVAKDNNNVEYGLFYVDYDGKYSNGEEGTVYLKAKTNIGKISSLDGHDVKEDALNIMKELNPQWAEDRKNVPISDLGNNEKGASYLCDTTVSIWSGVQTAFKNKYGDKNVRYVIAGPSAEMVFEAYNSSVENSTYSTKYFKAINKWGADPRFCGYRYSSDGGTTYTDTLADIPLTKNGGKWDFYKDSKYEWLCSPRADATSDFVVCSASWGAVMGSNFRNDGYVYPFVSLKAGVDLTK